MKAAIMFLVFSISGCSWTRVLEFEAGNCIQATDGYIWKINRIENSKYISEGWQGNAWGNEVEMSRDVLSKNNGYRKISCPQHKVK